MAVVARDRVPASPAGAGRVGGDGAPRAGRGVFVESPETRVEPLLARAHENPILAPTAHWWESSAVFNPGVVDGPDGVVRILYRAIGRDGISRFGYARTRDGVTIEERSASPVFEPELGNEDEKLGVEDPRIIVLDGAYHVTYTAVSAYLPSRDVDPSFSAATPPSRIRVSLALTEDFRTFRRYGVILEEMNDKDAVLFPERINGRYVILHRLPPDVWISTSVDLRAWEDHRSVLRTRPASWDETKVGAGTPPIRIPEGWLLLYHGSDHHNVYRAGCALLDPRDPSVVLGRSAYPVLEPQESYERTGLVPRVVFPTGLVCRGDTLLVYYGAADTYVGVARASLRAVLASLR